MTQFLIRAWWWLLGCMAFFTVFAFALNNRAVVTVHWFFGYDSRIQLVLLVLLALMAGVFLGAVAVLPLWWRQYHQNRAATLGQGVADAQALNPLQATDRSLVAATAAPAASAAYTRTPAADEVIDAV